MKLRNKKTGEIIDLEQWRFEYYKGSGCIAITNDKNQDEEFYYEAFADMKDDWEDYAPKEPIIKDEKIRKAVRAWASVNGDTKVFYCRSTNQICVFDNEGYVVRSIRFKLEFREDIGLEDGYYTIAELCGEEEE